LRLRARILTLPVMVALILSMIWRQVGRHLRVDAPGAERSVALDSRAPGDPTGNF